MKDRAAGPKKLLLFAGALILLPPLALLMRAIGYQQFSALLTKFSPDPTFKTYGRWHQIPLARLIGGVINRAGRAGLYKATCLDRSVLLWWVLRWLRIPSKVRIGVRYDGAKFAAHAWVEIESYVINDRDDVQTTYLPLPDRTSPDTVARVMR